MWQSLCYFSCLMVPPLPLICATDIPQQTTLCHHTQTLHFTCSAKQIRTGLPALEWNRFSAFWLRSSVEWNVQLLLFCVQKVLPMSLSLNTKCPQVQVSSLA